MVKRLIQDGFCDESGSPAVSFLPDGVSPVGHVDHHDSPSAL